MSSHIWATRTATLSYTQITLFQVRNFLVDISKVYQVVKPNLTWIQLTLLTLSFYYGSDKTVLLECDYDSTRNLGPIVARGLNTSLY